MALFEPVAEMNWLDQSLHAAVGAIIAGLSLLVMPWYSAVFASMLVAVIREQWQHPGQCHAGCRTDLAFWLIGSSMVPIGAALIG